MKKNEAIELLLRDKLNRIGFESASFVDLPDEPTMDFGWFDLCDHDHNARMENEKLILDLWFVAYRFDGLPKEAIVDTKTISNGLQDATMHKLRMAVEISYICFDGERFMLI